jgi:glutamate-1-semialdehyde 2,1-aminomutase
MKVLCIIQARMGSTRLPGKILMEIEGKPMLHHELDRLSLSKLIDHVVVATGDGPENDPVETLCESLGVHSFRGSENDVLERYAKCAEKYPEYDAILRITGDNPLIDPYVIDELIEHFDGSGSEYASNVEPHQFLYPDGTDCEIFTRDMLMRAQKEATTEYEREHVTVFMEQSEDVKKSFITQELDFSHIRLTVDNPEDFEVISYLIREADPDCGYLHYIALLTKRPGIMVKNMHLERNEGGQE